MVAQNHSATIADLHQLQDVADRCVNTFWADATGQPLPAYTFTPFDSNPFPVSTPDYRGYRIVTMSRTARNLEFTFHTSHILGQPKVVLEAALELELAHLLLKQMRGHFRFNYQRSIAPLIPVSGGAVHVIRNMVWEIEMALQRHAATRFLIDRQRGRSQMLFYFNRLQPSDKERGDYRLRQPHDWVHALYLCQKCSLFLPMVLLQNNGLSPGLISYWWDCHRFFTRSDRDLLERLAEVPTQNLTGAATAPPAERYEDQVVAMFRLLPA